MKRASWTVMIGFIALAVIDAERPMVRAAEPAAASRPAGVAPACPNAAVHYWSAFGSMPPFDSKRDDFQPSQDSIPKDARANVDLLLKRYAPALHELHRARTVAACDWQLDYDADPFVNPAHLGPTRMLTRAALLRARVRFADGQTDGAIADVVAVLKMGRDCACSPVLVSLLTDCAVEEMASQVLAANLPRLTPKQLDELAKSLVSLPPSTTLADCLRVEENLFCDWLEKRIAADADKHKGPQAGVKVFQGLANELVSVIEELDGKAVPKQPLSPEQQRRRDMLRTLTVDELKESVRVLRTDYEELAKISALPYTEQPKRWAAFEAKLKESDKLKDRADLHRVLSNLLLPGTLPALTREEELHLRRKLLALAVEVQRHGPDALKSAPKELDGKVEFQKTKEGFELRIPRAVTYSFESDKMVTLRVKAAK